MHQTHRREHCPPPAPVIEESAKAASNTTSIFPLEPDPKACCVRCGVVIPGNGATVMVNGDVDGGAPSDLSAGGQRLSERSEGCGVGAAGTAADNQVGYDAATPASR
jgi:hypothetical protein